MILACKRVTEKLLERINALQNAICTAKLQDDATEEKNCELKEVKAENAQTKKKLGQLEIEKQGLEIQLLAEFNCTDAAKVIVNYEELRNKNKTSKEIVRDIEEKVGIE